jgi:hypothetical protein
VAITQESKLVGSGTVTLKVATYDAASSSSGALDTGLERDARDGAGGR